MTGKGDTGYVVWSLPLTRFLLIRFKRAGIITDHNDNYMRLFWSCFMIEWY